MTPAAFAATHAKAFSATRAWSSDEFARLLGQRGVIWEGDAKCFALMRVVADEAEVLTIATDPAFRRQGLARRVLARSEQASASLGAGQVFLEVAEDNAGARALYNSSGYIQVGRRPGYYLPKDGAPVAALVLRKQLETT